jgi:hypothetical protein
MRPTQYYDELGDILYVNFVKAKGSRGITLNDNVILRLDPDTLQPVKLVLHSYSILVALSSSADRDFEITVSAIPAKYRAAVLRALKSAPLNEFLELRGTAKRPRLALAPSLLPQIAQAA